MSPYSEFGEKIISSQTLYISLKGKGDKVKFRILGKPYYNGKHFTKDGDKWIVTPCPRINSKEDCDLCEKYFKTMAEANKNKKDKELFEAGKKEANKYKNTISVYFPIINRDLEQFQIFQTKVGIKNKIDAEILLGTPILERDFIVMRTEVPGSDYYTLSRVDSADSKDFTDKEKSEVKKFKEMDLEAVINGVKDDESPISEDINVDDIDL